MTDNRSWFTNNQALTCRVDNGVPTSAHAVDLALGQRRARRMASVLRAGAVDAPST